MAEDAGAPAAELTEEEKAALCPEGCKPMMISMKNMKERYGLSTGDGIKDVMPYKLFPIAWVQDEYRKIGFYSDFFNFKAELEKYPDEQDVLVIADPDEKYGQNFFVCLTVPARDRELEAIKAVVEAAERAEAARLKAIADAKAAEEAAAAAIRNAVYVEKPIVIRPWQSGTQSATDAEIAHGNVFHSRKLVKVAISRRRRDFAGPYKFNEHDAETIAGSFPMEVRQSKDPNFELKRRTRDIGLQDCASWTASYLKIQRAVRTESGNAGSKVSANPDGGASSADGDAASAKEPSRAPSPSASPRNSDSKSNAASPRGETAPPRDPAMAVHERVPRKVVAACQTRFFSKQNNSTQFVDENALKGISSTGTSTSTSSGTSMSPRSSSSSVGADGGMALSIFLKSASRKLEESLQQNETVDIFRGDFSSLVEEETLSFGNRSENTLPELRTFTDLTYSKNKILKCIDWHPRSKKIVAVSCVENVSFDQRVESSGRAKNAYVLIWNFQNLIHPQLVLQSPLEVQCFRFNPTAPHLIAGGTISGQVILWDISESMEKLRAKGNSGHRNGGGRGRDDGGDDNDKAMPPLAPKYVTSIDESHKRPVTDLVWLPDYMNVNTRGVIKYNETSEETAQFATIAGDGQFLVWDVRFEEIARKRAAQRNEKRKDADASPEWKPHFKTVLNKLDGVGELGLRKISIQGKAAGSHFFVATEEGEFVDADWNGISGGAGGAGEEEEESGKKGGVGRRTVLSVNQDHFRPCVSLEQSPFFPDIYLSVGDWSFNLWCEGVEAPVFSSPFSEAYLMAGRWSPTRPGVIVLSRADGAVDIWDLTDQSHKPSMSAPIASTKLTSMEFADRKSSGTSMQLLAAGDGGGNLHILEMPRPMRRPSPNEKSVMRDFFDREVQRVQYMHQVQRERNDLEDEGDGNAGNGDDEEKMDAKAKRKAAAEERKRVKAQLKKEEEEYRKLEAKFREELGLSGSDSPAAPASPASAKASEGEVDAEGVEIEVKEGEAEKTEF